MSEALAVFLILTYGFVFHMDTIFFFGESYYRLVFCLDNWRSPNTLSAGSLSVSLTNLLNIAVDLSPVVSRMSLNRTNSRRPYC